MQYGFVIDHDSCIGCHACTVACKAENDVPVGNFRTWVKYTEEGTFPDIKRDFLVQRCNHCSDAPCVTICPVNALEKRPDGIVDLDRDACIGCRACMQACPYDAIYLNEDSGAAEKCHFCAHRVEVGLEPACSVVCPVNAIIAGDLDDPDSRVARLSRERETVVRRPEQETNPNVRYIGASDLALNPGRAARPDMYMFSERPPAKPEAWPADAPLTPNARVVLDAGHRVEWGWPVALYLVTKGIAAGVAMLAPLAGRLGLTGNAGRIAPEVIALIFLAVTCFLLVEDLARPMRFYRLITRPNWKSWLVRGGVLLGVFGAVVAATLGLRLAGMDAAADAGRWLGAALGVGVAGYTAFLFGQCKGRDLWESPLLLPHLIAQALMCGSAVFLAFTGRHTALGLVFVIGVLGHLAFALIERRGRHETENARQAAAFLSVVRLWGIPAYAGGLIVGGAVALALLAAWPAGVIVPTLLGLYLYEHAYVRAAQLPPLS
ncbi:MAG: polysulfide reductase NrfD [Phycisphaerae bacterium]|nr:polysulfide reductase NrfD [Phycisphaerae bacterium]